MTLNYLHCVLDLKATTQCSSFAGAVSSLEKFTGEREC